MSTVEVREFHRDGIRVWLTCWSGRCWLDLQVDSTQHPATATVHVEALLQHRAADGWPQGLPRRLFETEVAVAPRKNAHASGTYVDLPYRLTPELLSTCHWRVTPHDLTGGDGGPN